MATKEELKAIEAWEKKSGMKFGSAKHRAAESKKYLKKLDKTTKQKK